MLLAVVSSFIALSAWGIYCYFFFQFWTHKAPSSFRVLVAFKGSNTRAHLGRQVLIHKSFLPVLDDLNKRAGKLGLKLIITSSYRSPNQKLSKQIVRPATTSNHLAGNAVDLNVKFNGKLFESVDMMAENLNNLPGPVRLFIQEIRENESIRWGGDFKTPDPVHVDSGLNKKDFTVWKHCHDDCFEDYSKARPKWKILFEKVVAL